MSGKPICKYGTSCYRQNPQHLKDFAHPEKEASSNPKAKKMSKTFIKLDAANKVRCLLVQSRCGAALNL